MKNWNSWSTATKVWLIIAAVAVVAAIVLCIVFRKKLAKLLRVYKSEVKKIVWLPWPQTKKSTLVVLITMLVSAAAICPQCRPEVVTITTASISGSLTISSKSV